MWVILIILFSHRCLPTGGASGDPKAFVSGGPTVSVSASVAAAVSSSMEGASSASSVGPSGFSDKTPSGPDGVSSVTTAGSNVAKVRPQQVGKIYDL